MNYWLINPKSDGVGTNTSVLSNKVVYMGWGLMIVLNSTMKYNLETLS